MTAVTRESPVQQERLAQARAVLTAAERSAARWGGRIDRTALRPVPAQGSAPGSTPETGMPEGDDGTGAHLPVPEPLADLFPGVGVRAGSSIAVQGTAPTSLLLALAVAAAGEDSWCAVAGMPDLGLRSALDAGLDPCRLALAPAEGEQRPQVLSALADGVGVLVLGSELELAPALWRNLLGRARATDTLVLAARPPGTADITLHTTTLGWTGLGKGSGRLRKRRLHVTSSGRGIAGQREVQVLLPQVAGRIEHGTAATHPVVVRAASRPALHPVRRAG